MINVVAFQVSLTLGVGTCVVAAEAIRGASIKAPGQGSRMGFMSLPAAQLLMYTLRQI